MVPDSAKKAFKTDKEAVKILFSPGRSHKRYQREGVSCALPGLDLSAFDGLMCQPFQIRGNDPGLNRKRHSLYQCTDQRTVR